MLHINRQQVDAALTWPDLVEAMRNAHREGTRPSIDDMLIGPAGRSLLVRAAFFSGVGIGLKAVTVFPENPKREPPKPTVQGEFLLYDEDDGQLLASIDGAGITPWKTAADSALGSLLLCRPDVRVMTVVGAGVMSRPLIEAHLSVRPAIEEVIIWNRTRANAERLVPELAGSRARIRVSDDLRQAVQAADLVSTATASVEPLICGDWLKSGTHLDLVGAFRPDMREADDRALIRGRLFVDARETTLEHIGELHIPLQAGTISAGDIEGDFFDLCSGLTIDRRPDDITIFKNGGGAHLDLITARLIYQRVTDESR